MGELISSELFVVENQKIVKGQLKGGKQLKKIGLKREFEPGFSWKNPSNIYYLLLATKACNKGTLVRA